ncbi:MAG: alpha/beta fold hydrolase [Ktedonobacterales bacterium]
MMTEKPTVVFIHGSGDSSLVWQEVTNRLTEQRWVALDLPGHGQLHDRPVPESMSVGDYAAEVEKELERLDLSQVCLAGHSLGGAIALHMALHSGSPLVVRGLALIGTGARLRVAPQLLETARSDPQAAIGMLDELAVAPGHEELARRYRGQSGPSTPPGILYRDLAACNAFDVMADLAHISQPAIIITGEQDRLTPPKYAVFLEENLPNATLALIPDAGHYVPIEQPAALAQALTSWLATSSLSRPTTGR